jgi:hypothetical protein
MILDKWQRQADGSRVRLACFHLRRSASPTPVEPYSLVQTYTYTIHPSYIRVLCSRCLLASVRLSLPAAVRLSAAGVRAGGVGATS